MANWEQIGIEALPSDVRAVCSAGGYLFAATNGGAGIYRSDDGGDTFEPKGDGISGPWGRDLYYDGSRLWAAMAAEGVWFSDDLGESWSLLAGINATSVNSVIAYGDYVFAATDHGVWRSVDGDPFERIADAGYRCRRIFASGGGGVIYSRLDLTSAVMVSADNGDTFSRLGGVNAPEQINRMAIIGDRVLIGSGDAPSMWTASLNSFDGYSDVSGGWAEFDDAIGYPGGILAVMPFLMASGDGLTWEEPAGITGGSPFFRMGMHDGVLFATTTNAGLFRLSGDIVFNKTIIASAGLHGTISPHGLVTVPSGGSQAFSFTPDPGWEISDVLIDGNSAGVHEYYRFTDVTGDHTIVPQFSKVTGMLGNKQKRFSGGGDMFFSGDNGGTVQYLGVVREGTQQVSATPFEERDTRGLLLQPGVEIKAAAELLQTQSDDLTLFDGMRNKRGELWVVADRYTTILKGVSATLGYDSAATSKKPAAGKLSAGKFAPTATDGIWQLAGRYDPRYIFLLIAPELQKPTGSSTLIDDTSMRNWTPFLYNVGDPESFWSNDKKSLLFDGVNDYVQIPDEVLAGVRFLGTADATLVCWFKVAEPGGVMPLIGIEGNALRMWIGSAGDGGVLKGYQSDGIDWTGVSGETNVADGQLHCAALTYKNGGDNFLRLFLDGEQIGGTDMNSNTLPSEYDSTIQIGTNDEDYFGGHMEATMVLRGKAWSADEVRAYYRSVLASR